MHEFNIYDNYDNPLTLPHDIYVNDVKIDGKTFNFDQVSEGNKVYAKYNSDFVGEIVSDELSFDVVNFNKRVLVEDYTGAWCGYCPRLAYRLEEAESLNDKVVPVAIHYDDPIHGTVMLMLLLQSLMLMVFQQEELIVLMNGMKHITS